MPLGSAPAYEAILELLAARTGLSFGPRRSVMAETGIRRAMSRAGTERISHYLQNLKADSVLFDDLVAEMTVGESYFFREPQHFAFLRDEVLPGFDQRRGAGHPLHLWSAGCASGEEPYSLAILLEEAGRRGHTSILGTDVSQPALARATAGSYSAWSLRGMDAGLVRRYFHHIDDRYVLSDQIRGQVTFRPLNLALAAFPEAGPGPFDVVFCRNVLIYFHRDAVVRCGHQLFHSLSEGGWLVTGSSDPPLGETAPYQCIVTGAGVFYRRGERQSGVHAAASDRKHPVSWRSDDPNVGRQAESDATDGVDDDPAQSAARIRAVADTEGVAAAAARVRAAVRRHPLAAELHLLRALLLVELGEDAQAAAAARRAAYLDPSAEAGQLVLTSILRRRAHTHGAARDRSPSGSGSHPEERP